MSLTDLGFLFDDNPNPMWIFELSSLRILKVNKAAIFRYRYTEEEFLNMSTDDLHASVGFEDADQLNKPITGVWKHQNKNGEFIHAEITGNNIKFQNADCRIVVATDVSERLRYQEQASLREQELIWTKNSLEALINNTEDQIWSVDKELRYVYMNKAYRDQIAEFTGGEPKEGDYSYLQGFDAVVNEKWNEYYNRTLKGEIYSIINESYHPGKQRLLSFEISFNPIFKSSNEIIGIGCFARDITERLQTEKAIVEQNERLRHIASLTSHELRRPVASMLGLINIMDRSNFFNPDNKEIIEHLLTVGNEIDEVIRLVVDKTFTEDPSKKYLAP
jgi:PAS domain S-box-containing protein